MLSEVRSWSPCLGFLTQSLNRKARSCTPDLVKLLYLLRRIQDSFHWKSLLLLLAPCFEIQIFDLAALRHWICHLRDSLGSWICNFDSHFWAVNLRIFCASDRNPLVEAVGTQSHLNSLSHCRSGMGGVYARWNQSKVVLVGDYIWLLASNRISCLASLMHSVK